MTEGLTSNTAKELLVRHGFNELPDSKSRNILRIALDVVKEPMFLLLISCATLYIVLGDYKEGAILLFTILIIIYITFYQAQKTEKALDALKKLSSPRALVVRDNTHIRIAARELVPGDFIILNEGDRIPADGIILESTNLTVDESLLTGESIPVLKNNSESVKDNNIFSGSLVVQGHAKCEITKTGIHTEFGRIGKSLESIEEDETRLQKEMKILIRNLFIAGIVISVIVVVSFYFVRGNFIQSLLTGLSAAMAILPEEFPVVLTVFLALGSWRLSRINVLTRKPSAIETLGSATVLCTDKTGTITQNKMEVAALYCNYRLYSKTEFSDEKDSIHDLVFHSLLACPEDSSDPMDNAIHAISGFLQKERSKFKFIKEYPLRKNLLAVTRVYQSENNLNYQVAMKGAPETIFKLCKLSSGELAKLMVEVSLLADQGYRVIAAASAKCPAENITNDVSQFDVTFSGLIALEDPIRPEVPGALKQCLSAGVKVIMITGDFPNTAKSIANQIGLPSDGKIITGSELNEIKDADLNQRIKDVSIFARVVPEQKLRIVQALKANNEIVAMTGDGVNDAPALKAAHIGIAMGKKGTDVAREASSLVLLDDNFASIVAAIRSGRRIFDNLQKAMSYIIAIHVPIIGLTLMPAFNYALPLILLPLHIVFMELIIDPVCSVAFEYEQEEKGIMQRKPRNPDELFFGRKKLIAGFIEGLLLFCMVLIVFYLSMGEGHSHQEIRAITFTALIFGNVFMILSKLSRTRSFISILVERNYAAIIVFLSALIMLFLVISIPSLQTLFGFAFPGYIHFVPSVVGATILLLILEFRKIKFQKKV